MARSLSTLRRTPAPAPAPRTPVTLEEQIKFFLDDMARREATACQAAHKRLSDALDTISRPDGNVSHQMEWMNSAYKDAATITTIRRYRAMYDTMIGDGSAYQDVLVVLENTLQAEINRAANNASSWSDPCRMMVQGASLEATHWMHEHVRYAIRFFACEAKIAAKQANSGAVHHWDLTAE